jgi:hypothetical protein
MAKSKEPNRTRKATRRTGEVRPRKPRLPKPRYLDWRTFDPSMFANADDAMIDEMVTYRDNLKELLRHKGKYVVIKGREIIGIYADEQQALLEAATRFGGEPAMVKQIVAREPFVYMGGIVY